MKIQPLTHNRLQTQETTMGTYNGDTHTFEFSTDVKMVNSSFVDEASGPTDQISTSTESNESAQCIFKMKQSPH
jgi:hypothetical protein